MPEIEEWARLPDVRGFACRVHLTEDSTASSTVLRLQLSDPAGFDNYLATQTPDNISDAADDRLLLIMADLDATEGKVLMREGLPSVEIMSVVSRTAIAGPPFNVFDFEVLRSRMDTLIFSSAQSTDPDDPTRNRSWVTGAKGWILPAVNFVAVTHPLIDSMVRDTDIGRIQLVAYTRVAEDVTSPIPERSFQLPLRYDTVPKITWVSPAVSPFTAPSSGEVSINVHVTDGGGNIVRVALSSRLGSGTPVTHFDAEFPATGVYDMVGDITLAGVGDHRLQVRARDTDGNETSSLLTVSVPTAGGQGPGVTFTPGSSSFATRLCVQVSVDGSRFNTLAYRITKPQATPPSSMIGYPGTSIQLCVDQDSYIWVAGGVNGHSALAPVFASYTRTN